VKAPAQSSGAQRPPTSVVLYFQVHQPFRLRHFTFFDIGAGGGWFDDAENERIVRRVAERCYRPTNAILLEQVERFEGRFRCAFSVSGTALDQMERWAPEALESFVKLARTGCVEFLAETSHHSLASLADAAEFDAQARAQMRRVEALFGRRPTAFRNTELVVSEPIARRVEELGFEVLLAEGADHLLGWRSPRHVYRPEGCERLKLLLRDYVLSDDVAFRFSNRDWPEWPLSAERFAAKLAAAEARERYVGLFMDFETFGEHQWEETGILAFLRELPAAVLAHPNLGFGTPTEVARELDPVARLSIPRPVSWADAERDLTAWLGNPMQAAAHEGLYALAAAVREQGDARLLEDWRRLSTSDHFYYMCTKWFSDGDVHKYFSPYATPHDAFISFMNVLDDLERRVRAPSGTPVQALAEAKARSEPPTAPSSRRKPRKSASARSTSQKAASPKATARKRSARKPKARSDRRGKQASKSQTRARQPRKPRKKTPR
jgi:alpha-amylase